MKPKLSLALTIAFSIQTLTGGELEDFLAHESKENKDFGERHPSVVQLEEIKNEKNRERALELALTYVRELYHFQKKKSEEFWNKVKYTEILLECKKKEDIPAGREFLLKMFSEGSISEISVTDSGFKVKVRSGATGELSKIFNKGYWYKAVALHFEEHPSSAEE